MSIRSITVICAMVLLSGVNRGNSQPADSPWPMFGYNAQRTGKGMERGPQEGSLAWTHILVGVRGGPVVGEGGNVYIHYHDGLLALDPDGVELWEQPLGTDEYQIAVGVGENIYATGGEDKRLYRLNSAGTLMWSYEFGGDVHVAPVIDSTGRILVGSADNGVYAIRSTGTLSWSYETEESMDGGITLSGDGAVYAAAHSGSVYTFSSSGDLSWSYEVFSNYTVIPSVGPSGTVYSRLSDARLGAFTSEGALIWSYRTEGSFRQSVALGADEKIYRGSGDNNLYVFHSTGALSWSYAMGDWIGYAPALDAEDTTYVGSMDERYYAIDSSGLLLWSYQTDGSSHGSVAISDNNTAYGRKLLYLYCFRDATPTPTPTDAPTELPTPQPSATPTPQPPQAVIACNGDVFGAGDYLNATFRLNETIRQPFNVYAALVLPNGRMLNARTLNRPLKPVARAVPVLHAPFSFPLLSKNIPGVAPKGEYELVVAFFAYGQPIHGRSDAFLEACATFTIE